MLIVGKRIAWPIAIAITCAWFFYVLWSTTPFQNCLGSNEEKYKATEKAKNNAPKGFFSLRIVAARDDTICLGHVIYDYRDAVSALATVFIAFFTLTLWRSTRRLSKEAETASRIGNMAAAAALKTAEVAERALTLLERPYLFIDLTSAIFKNVRKNFGGQVTYDTAANVIPITYSFRNTGRTVAILTHQRESFAVSKELPAPFNAAEIGRVEDALPPGNAIGQVRSFDTVFRSDDLIGDGFRAPLVFMGYVRYKDIFDRSHVTGFCARFDWASNRFVLEGDERYNYNRDE